MELQDQILQHTAKECTGEASNSGKPIFITRLFLSRNSWKSTRRALTWQTRYTKKGRLIIKLNASDKLSKKYLDLFPSARETPGHLTGPGRQFRTPLASDGQKSSNKRCYLCKRYLTSPVKDLPGQVAFLETFLTPQGSDGDRTKFKLTSLCKRYLDHPGGNLAEQVAFKTFFPTPTASAPMQEGMKKVQWNGENRHSMTLGQAARIFPTPRASDSKGACPKRIKGVVSGKEKRFQLREAVYQAKDDMEKKLNPVWVEWLMGYPANWTAMLN